MTGHGRFITFEGGEGSGKTTQIKLLADAFERAGISCLRTREPGGTEGAENIRGLLVDRGVEWDTRAETLLFYAARAEHAAKLIRPALEKGRVVLCDRFADSTLVYQSIGKGVPVDFVKELHRLTLGELAPDLTFLLDILPAVGLQRAEARSGGENRFEMLGQAFHQKVRQGFLQLANEEPNRFCVIQADMPREALHRNILERVNSKFTFTLQPVA